MPSQYPYKNIPDDVLKEAAEQDKKAPQTDKNTSKKQPEKSKGTDGGKNGGVKKETKQRGLFKKRRAGVVLTKEEVKEIKEGRKKLRKEMKSRGIKGKRDFEAVAGSLGLYFDKRRYGLIPWLLSHWLATLIAALVAFLVVLFLFSAVTKMRGYYTVNLSDTMFREGFTLSETEDFKNPTVELFAQPAENIPCVSIKHIAKDVDKIDGQHNSDYFAYTYYIRNEGHSTVDIVWELELNSESKDLSSAAWIALYVDGKLGIYAKPNTETGEPESLPPLDITNKGYLSLPIMESDPDNDQFSIVAQKDNVIYYRVTPRKFETDTMIASGLIENVEPQQIHKYTVVLWLEGDDIDADNSKIGGHLGTQMNFRLANETTGDQKNIGSFWKDLWDNLKFW